ncbi:hypothetical protein [Pseudomonas allokribbensis]|uniref:hypothetical protein n=1 Tax=Pseudomonas allokribbensis TaxID=2774460 RepID=UPI001787C979|nr:hypothetical protein [Pseudomonas allokribbensis]
MDALLCLMVLAGTWWWVVKQRGEWNLLLGNLAGAGSSVVTGIVFTLIYDGVILAYEEDCLSPPLRDDLVMGDYQRAFCCLG